MQYFREPFEAFKVLPTKSTVQKSMRLKVEKIASAVMFGTVKGEDCTSVSNTQVLKGDKLGTLVY
jgi:hypothetical protein